MSRASNLGYMIIYSSEVIAAQKANKPVVALESTIISHGLPRPRNLEVALEVDSRATTGLLAFWAAATALE